MTRDQLLMALGNCTGCGEPLEHTAREVCTATVGYRLDLAAADWADSYTGQHDIWEESDRDCYFECTCATEVEPEQAIYIGALVHGWSLEQIAEELAKLQDPD